MNRTPRVSVMSSAYNNELYIAQAIESVLAQTWTDFEYIIVEDASTDGTRGIVAHYAAQDRRIVPLWNEQNLGLARTLNRGWQAASGEFVANLDGDDLAGPKRLERQVAFLDAHPNVDVVGTFNNWIDETGKVLSYATYPTKPGQIRWDMLFRCSVLHSAAFLRREAIARVGGYSENHYYAPEYELYSRMLPQTDMANVPENLASYRASSTQMSNVHRRVQHGEVIMMLYAMYKRRLRFKPKFQALESLYGATRGGKLDAQDQVRGAVELLETTYSSFLELEAPDAATRDYVRRDFALKLFRLAHGNQVLVPDQYDGWVERALALDPELMSRAHVKSFLAGLEKPVSGADS